MEYNQIDNFYRQFMAAMAAITKGRDTAIFSPVGPNQPPGQRRSLREALSNAPQLDETVTVHAEHLDLVEQACKILGISRRSDRISEVAQQILDAGAAPGIGRPRWCAFVPNDGLHFEVPYRDPDLDRPDNDFDLRWVIDQSVVPDGTTAKAFAQKNESAILAAVVDWIGKNGLSSPGGNPRRLLAEHLSAGRQGGEKNLATLAPFDP